MCLLFQINSNFLCNLFSRFLSPFNFWNGQQESLAFIFEMAQLHEDALREYDELELCYLETGAYSMNALLSLAFIFEMPCLDIMLDKPL